MRMFLPSLIYINLSERNFVSVSSVSLQSNSGWFCSPATVPSSAFFGLDSFRIKTSVILPGNTCWSLLRGFWPSELLVVENTVCNLCFTSLLRPRQSFHSDKVHLLQLSGTGYCFLSTTYYRSNIFKEAWEQRETQISDSCLVFILFSCKPLAVFLAVSGNSVRKAGVEMEKGRLESSF